MSKKGRKSRGLEVMSHDDGAWYDVDCKHSRVQAGKLRVRFMYVSPDCLLYFNPVLLTWTVMFLDRSINAASPRVEDCEF